MHEPLSEKLRCVLETESPGIAITANQLILRTQGRGIYFVFLILSLPFVAWVSIPGFSTVCGPIIAWLGLRLAFNATPRLPRILGDRPLSPRMNQLVLGGGLKVCRFLERFVRPRRTVWMSWRLARTVNALLIVFMGFLLALPLPSPPFLGSNTLPSYAVILLTIAMMEEDGWFIWLGYAMSLVATAYFAVLGELISRHLGAWFQAFLRLLESTQ